MKVLVIAGSPVDTSMGAEVLNKYNIETISLPVSAGAREQTSFQFLPYETKFNKIIELVKEGKKAGAERVMIYCNSLSSNIDMKEVEKKEDIRVVTPLNVYEKLGKQFNKIGVMAGNSQGLAGIERAFGSSNPNIEILGISNLSLVEKVEQKLSPDRIVEQLGIDKLVSYYETNNVEAIILGCTHFPYIKEKLESMTKLRIIDPALIMKDMLEE